MRKPRQFELGVAELQRRVARHCELGLVEISGRVSRATPSAVVGLSPRLRQELERLSQLDVSAGPTTQQAGIVQLWNTAVELVSKIVRDGGGDPTTGATTGPLPGDSAEDPGTTDGYPTV
jgi:hypothetical protein